jgi:hypothetical protein
MTTEQHSHEVRPIVVQPGRSFATWIIAIALSVIATCLVVRQEPSFMGAAFGQTSAMGTQGIHAFTGQLDRDKYGLFMMDVDGGTVWVYEYFPMKHRLKLACARSFKYDRYLEDFNNDDLTTPDKIRELVERQRSRRGTGFSSPPTQSPAPTPAPEPAAAARDPRDGAPVAAPTPHLPVSVSPAVPIPDVRDPDADAADALGDDAKIESVGAEREEAVETAPGQTKNP